MVWWLNAPGAAKNFEAQAREQRNLWHEATSQYGDFRTQQDADLRGGMNLYKSAIGDIEGGFAAALRAASLSGRGSKRQIKEGGQQLQASTQQSLVSRGLHGTTALDNANRGIASDTSRRLQEVDESIASLIGQLSVGKGQALAGAKMGQAGFGAQASAMRQSSLENYLNLLRDKPQKFNRDAFYMQVGRQAESDAGSFIGSFFGGGG